MFSQLNLGYAFLATKSQKWCVSLSAQHIRNINVPYTGDINYNHGVTQIAY